MINNILPYFRKEISTLVTISAASLLLLSSPLLPLSNFLLQPVQAQTAMTFKTPKPADGTLSESHVDASLTFDVHGTTTTPGSSSLKVTNGTFQITSKENGKILQSGSISRGSLIDLSSETKLNLISTTGDPSNPLIIDTLCSTSATNGIFVHLTSGAPVGGFRGVVECSPQGGNSTTTTNQQESSTSSMAAGSSQDGDSDGIPDSSDKCTHNSNPRCFKEAT